MNKWIYFLLGLVTALACSKKQTEGEKIIADSIKASGGSTYEKSIISFDFRGRYYSIDRDGGTFEMVRLWEDTSGVIKDVFTNDTFTRYINEVKTEVHDTMAFKYQESINSVFYFALLPFKLDDAAVNPTYLGEKEVKGKNYHKILISFDEEGGGTDHDDNFIYWIDKETGFIDYLAYEYATNGGGMRFRSAYNERIVSGVRFVDYINYKPKVKGSVNLEEIDDAFEKGDLEELSKIELENIEVE